MKIRTCFSGPPFRGPAPSMVVSQAMEAMVTTGLRGLFNPAANVHAQFEVRRRELLLAFIDDAAATGRYTEAEIQQAREWVEKICSRKPDRIVPMSKTATAFDHVKELHEHNEKVHATYAELRNALEAGLHPTPRVRIALEKHRQAIQEAKSASDAKVNELDPDAEEA